MSHRTDARHGQRRVHPSTRVLLWRAVGVGIGFLLSVPLMLVAVAVGGGPH